LKARAYNQAHPEKYLARALRQKFGMSIAHYESLLAKQGGRCAICRKEKSGGNKRLSVDHDHATGKVRGLLCDTCNHGLGSFYDEASLLQKAAAYVEARLG
jgi:hypothetical protein